MSKRLIAGINIAIKLETKGLEFYTKCLKGTRREEAKELFKYLIKAEKVHKLGLEDIKKGIIAKDKTLMKKGTNSIMKLSIPIPLFKKHDLEHMTKCTTSLRQMLNKAMNLEREGLGFYLGMALKEKDPVLKAFWKKIGNDELLHKQEIERVGFVMLGIPKWEVV